MRILAPALAALVAIHGAVVHPAHADPRELRVQIWSRQAIWSHREERAPVWVRWRSPGGVTSLCGPRPQYIGRCESFEPGGPGWRELLVGESVGTWVARARLALDGSEDEVTIDVQTGAVGIHLARRSSALRFAENGQRGAVLVNDGAAVVYVETSNGVAASELERWSGPEGLWRATHRRGYREGRPAAALAPGDRVDVVMPDPEMPGRYRWLFRTRPEELSRDGDVRVTMSYRVVRELSVP